jgi:hypothetical protein
MVEAPGFSPADCYPQTIGLQPRPAAKAANHIRPKFTGLKPGASTGVEEIISATNKRVP